MATPSPQSDIPITMGALLVGGFFATMLSGVVILQTLWYFVTYKSDSKGLKVLVLGVCVLDSIHTSFIWAAMWTYLVGRYGSFELDYIPWSISSTVLLTATVTFLVHCFFARRIWMLSRRNLLMVAPVVILALLRLVSAFVSTYEMFHYKSYRLFKVHAFWIFTLGLSVSSAVDILITGLLFYLFQSTRHESGHWHLNYILNKLSLYAFETGSLTCIGTVVSMICWVTMSDNLIFLGLHFVIGKLYASSLLVTLNTREAIRQAHSIGSSGERGQNPVLFLARRRPSDTENINFAGPATKVTELQVNVQTIASVHYDETDRESVEAK
ncbi:hypothetical protein FB45DRAFT_1063261 [Roridomyces roridus]|uniref:DUF6534 domain-containing protein n=1 Tax=Roridomyces roridus TaxID=1738132 RepID=A0AAD7BF44_9AGAR|nr:hypothetical protein FB45DRAFT_1063261 [Roridomyces roridus]